MKGGARELKTKNTRQRHTRWVHGFPSRQLLGLVPFPYSSKPSIVMPRCRGRPLEFTFAQSPVFLGLALFLFPEAENHQQQATSRCAYGIPSRQLLGLVPFPYSSKPSSYPAVAGDSWNLPLHSHQLGWSLFRTVQNQVQPCPAVAGRLLEFTFAQSPVFCRSGPFFTKKHRRQQLCGSVGQRS